MTEAATRTRGADVVPVSPPLYYLVGLALGALAQAVVPLSFDGHPVTTAVGATAVVLGLALTVGGVAGVIRHRTTVVPHRSVTRLVDDGFYTLSRNPMYTGLSIAYLGVSLLLGSWWSLLLWVPVMLAVDRLVVRPEERYLAERFGTAYADYRTRVRRWL